MIDQIIFSQMFTASGFFRFILLTCVLQHEPELRRKHSNCFILFLWCLARKGRVCCCQATFFCARPASSFLSVIRDHRLQNELSVPNVLDRRILVMRCRMLNSFFEYLFLASFESFNCKCFFDPCSVCAQWYESAGGSRHIHLNLSSTLS